MRRVGVSSPPPPGAAALLSRRSTFTSRYAGWQAGAKLLVRQGTVADLDDILQKTDTAEDKDEAALAHKEADAEEDATLVRQLTTHGFQSILHQEEASEAPAGTGRVQAQKSGFGQRTMGALFRLDTQGSVVHDSRAYALVSVGLTVALAWTVLRSPYRAAVLDASNAALGPGVVLLDTLVCLAHGFGIAVQLFDCDGRHVKLQAARRSYARSWFLVDALACIPAELLLSAFRPDLDPAQPSVLRLCRALFFLRALKVARVANLGSALSTGSFNLSRGARRLASVGVIVPVVSHATACLWIVQQAADNVAPGAQSWSSAYFGPEAMPAPLLDTYLGSLYWTVSTLNAVGFGDVSAQNNGELIFSILASLCGGILAGFVIAHMSSVLVDLSETTSAMASRVNSIKAYLAYRRVPKALSKRIGAYFRMFWAKKTCFDETSIMENLTSDLRTELSLFLLKETIDDLEIFRGLTEPKLVATLVRLLKPVSFARGEPIIQQGDPAMEMYFLVRGDVQVFAGSEVIARMGPGNHFGEFCTVGEDGLDVHRATVRPLTSVDLFVLCKRHIEILAERFPIVQERLETFTARKKQVYDRLLCRLGGATGENDPEGPGAPGKPGDQGNVGDPQPNGPPGELKRMRSMGRTNSEAFVRTGGDQLALLSINAGLVQQDMLSPATSPVHMHSVPCGRRGFSKCSPEHDLVVQEAKTALDTMVKLAEDQGRLLAMLASRVQLQRSAARLI